MVKNRCVFLVLVGVLLSGVSLCCAVYSTKDFSSRVPIACVSFLCIPGLSCGVIALRFGKKLGWIAVLPNLYVCLHIAPISYALLRYFQMT